MSTGSGWSKFLRPNNRAAEHASLLCSVRHTAGSPATGETGVQLNSYVT